MQQDRTCMVVIIKKGYTKKEIEALMERHQKEKKKKGVDLKKYLGSIKLNEDPLDIQKKLRDEWK